MILHGFIISWKPKQINVIMTNTIFIMSTTKFYSVKSCRYFISIRQGLFKVPGPLLCVLTLQKLALLFVVQRCLVLLSRNIFQHIMEWANLELASSCYFQLGEHQRSVAMTGNFFVKIGDICCELPPSCLNVYRFNFSWVSATPNRR